MFTDDWEDNSDCSNVTNEWVTLEFTVEEEPFSLIGLNIYENSKGWGPTDSFQIDWINVGGAIEWSEWSEVCTNQYGCEIDPADLEGNEWIQFRLNLSTDEPTQTPVVTSVTFASGYQDSGEFVSSVVDAGQNATWDTLTAESTVPAGTSISYFTRTGNTATPDGSWSAWEAVNSPISSPDGRYLQYKAVLATTDEAVTPVLSDITLSYSAVTPTTNSSNSSPPTCNDTSPSSAPSLYGASVRDSSSILLQFSQSNDPVSEYVLEFGTESGNYQFAMANIGGKGTKEYLVQSLSPNTTYYFRVRAGNGCATGSWSNEISARTQGGSSQETLETEIVELTSTDIEVEKKDHLYTVQLGDTLSSVAGNLLGDPSRYLEIIDLNKDKYPSLLANPGVLEVGWELMLPTSQKEDELDSPEPVALLGHTVIVKVIDTNKNPVSGATVELHSTPRSTVTDDDGIARFENVERGNHKIVINQNGQIGEQFISVDDDENQEYQFTVEIKPVSPFRDFKVIGVIGFLVLLIVGLVVLIRLRR